MRRFVLGIAVAVTSLMPVMGVADDQQIADYIKSRLQAEQQQGNLRGFNVDMRVENGTVSFKGHVSNSAQEMTILRTAQQAGHLGVVKVVDDIDVTSVQTVSTESPTVGAAQQYPLPVAQPVPQMIPQQVQQPVMQMVQQPTQMVQQPTQMVQQPMQMVQQPMQMVQQPMQMVQQPMQQQVPYQQISTSTVVDPGSMNAGNRVISNGAPLAFANAGGANYGPANMPVPFANNGGGGATSQAPNLPGYAWPGYAAHPNYAAVSYPKQYSASAWPYIGPFYPYPQVPLGWRKVSLEWDDGWWMLDFHDK